MSKLTNVTKKYDQLDQFHNVIKIWYVEKLSTDGTMKVNSATG